MTRVLAGTPTVDLLRSICRAAPPERAKQHVTRAYECEQIGPGTARAIIVEFGLEAA